MEKMGIEELKKGYSLTEKLMLLILVRVKDGIGIDDIVFLFSQMTMDSEFKALLHEVVTHFKDMGLEAGDLDFSEIMELGTMGMMSVPKVIAAFKK